MKNKKKILIFAIFIYAFSSCYLDPPSPENNDITVINGTSDSLFFYIHGLGKYDDIYNIAYDTIAAKEKTAHEYNIAFNINKNKVLPNDTVHPYVRSNSWKDWASPYGGLTILFYKRNIQYLPAGATQSSDNVYRRMDLTLKQLDEVKYVIKLKNNIR